MKNIISYIIFFSFFSFNSFAETILPDVISEDINLTKAGSPYIVSHNILVKPGADINIEPGAKVVFKGSYTLTLRGSINAFGSKDELVQFQLDEGLSEGFFIHLISTSAKSSFNYVKVNNGRIFIDSSEIDVLNSELEINVHYSETFPAFGFRNSNIRIENCKLSGNTNLEGFIGEFSDNVIISNNIINDIADAIEFTNCTNSKISHNKVYNSNDDATDLNNCRNVIIENNQYFNPRDKCMSIGSYIKGRSTDIIIRNNLAVGGQIGIAVKDSAEAIIINNTFYNNEIAIVTENKLEGSGISSPIFINNIFYNYNKFYDDRFPAKVAFNYNLTENNNSLSGTGNIIADPMFKDPGKDDFSLKYNSPAINAGDPDTGLDPDNTRRDIGAFYYDLNSSVKSNIRDLNFKLNVIYSNYDYLEFVIFYDDNYKIELYDISGRLINNLFNAFLQEGYYHVILPQNLLNGTYFLKAENSKSEVIFKKYIK